MVGLLGDERNGGGVGGRFAILEKGFASWLGIGRMDGAGWLAGVVG